MNSHSFFSGIFQRETGSSLSLSSLPESTIPFSKDSCSSIPIFPSNSTSSEIIWVGAKENILISLNTYGQATSYNLIDRSKHFLITTNEERALKVFFAENHLFLAVKGKSQNAVQFYLIPIRSLQNQILNRTQILKRLVVSAKELKEFHIKTCKIVVESQSVVEVWDIMTEVMCERFPLRLGMQYQYFEDWYIFWEVLENETSFGVFSIKNRKIKRICLSTKQKVYFCRVVSNALVIGVQNCSLQSINLETFETVVIAGKVPKVMNEFETTENFFTVFQDNSCMINMKNEEIIRVSGSGEVLVCEINDYVYFWEENGKFGRIKEGISQILGVIDGVEQIGGNWDTSQVILACQREIIIYG